MDSMRNKYSRRLLLISAFLSGCSAIQGVEIPPNSALLRGYQTPCDGTLVVATNEEGTFGTSLTLKAGRARSYFRFTGPPLSSTVAGVLDDYYCADTVAGSVTFEAIAGRYYRPILTPLGEGYAVYIYESLNANGVPAVEVLAQSEAPIVSIHCGFYPFC